MHVNSTFKSEHHLLLIRTDVSPEANGLYNIHKHIVIPLISCVLHMTLALGKTFIRSWQ